MSIKCVSYNIWNDICVYCNEDIKQVDEDEPMRSLIDQQDDIEHIRMKVLGLITQCIEDIQKTVASSGLQMRDVGIGIEMYKSSTGSNIIELRMRQ